jgi:heat-inducible transcriptional repressor
LELSQRKQEILKEIILSFISNGEPVGSKTVMERMKKSYSSATIRNEMNDMEKMGFLEQPHTSAGRIPTARGYRFYVDSLMDEYRLSFEETLLLNSLLSEKYRDTEAILSDMTSLLAKMTGYAAFSFSKERIGTVRRFEGVYINPRSFLLVMVTSSGKALSKQLQAEFPLDADALEFIISILNDHLAKKELGGITMERMMAMEKELGEYRSLIGPLLRVIYELLAETGDVNVFVKGLSHLLSFPEFQDGDCVTHILRETENKEELIRRFHDEYNTGLRVHIGTDGQGLDRASFVVCPFRLGKTLEGTVCIVGPKRMNYAKAMARLEYLAKQIQAVHGFEPQLPLIETKGK